jgi:peptide/nickel transport system permease protein
MADPCPATVFLEVGEGSSLLQYITRRLLASLLVILGVSVISFMLLHLVPGDVITLQVMRMGAISEDERATLEHEMGLDQPLPVQYAKWLGNAVRGDLGDSIWTRQPVTERIRSAAFASLELAFFGLLWGIAISMPLSIISAVKRNSPFDYVSRLISIAGISIPEFWIATMVVLYLSLWFHYSPPLGYVSLLDDPIRNLNIMLIPSLILGFSISALISRMARSSMLEVLQQDYIRTARAKGLSERNVVWRHAVRNATIPVVTIIGSQFAYLMGGVLVLEIIFSVPGIGGLTYDAVVRRDYPQVQANVLFFAVIIVLMNLLVDVSYGWLDPRIRASR